MKSFRPVRGLLLCALLLAACQMAVAASTQLINRSDGSTLTFDPFVLEQVKTSGEVTYLVTLAEQADLSAAYAITDREQRGRYVYDTLRQVAGRSQASLLDDLGRHADVSELIPHFIVNGFHVRSGRSTLELLMADHRVASITGESKSYIPEPEEWPDESRAVEWGVAMVRAPEVWDLGIFGDGVVLASIDTGVQYNHPALEAMYRGTDTGSHDFNFFDPSNSCGGAVCDNNGHGTHVTGSMLGDDGGANQIGVAPGATWIAAKGCESNSCSDASLLASAEWMLAPCAFGDAPGDASCDPAQRPHVVNNSWGGGGGNAWYQASVDAWRASGIIPVFSAGNSGPGSGTIGSPSDYCNVMSIGGTNSSDGMYSSSSRGPGAFSECTDKPDMSAPGQSVRSAVPTNSYATYSGTSMASPHVSGCIALMLAAAPILEYDDIYDILISTAEDLGDPGFDYDYGHGRIDCLEAVNEALVLGGDLGTIAGVVTGDGGAALEGVQIVIDNPSPPPEDFSSTTDENGEYSRLVPVNDPSEGTYTLTFSRFGYETTVVSGVDVLVDQTTTIDLQMDLAPSIEISGSITDSATGWPLHARISIAGVPDSPVYSDPVDGSYSVTLPAGAFYDFTVEVLSGGYLPADREIDATGGVDLTEDFQVDTDLDACTAPGYADMAEVMYSEDFESDEGGFSETVVSGSAMWEWGSPVTWPESCGGGSNCWGTVLNGDYPNSSQAYVISPVIDLQSAAAPLTLLWDQANHIETFAWDQGRVEISIDGGAWDVLWENPGSTVQEGWRELSADISDAAGETIELRWRLTTDGSVNFAGLYFDNIRIQDATNCQAQAGELVSGQVTDANTGEPINGAGIAVDGNVVASTATSEDPQVGEGAYLVFVPEGNSELSATFPGYEPAQFSDDFTDGATRRVDFALGAGQLSVVPGEVVQTLTFGETDSLVVNLNNTGTSAADFSAFVSAGLTEDFESDFPPAGWSVEDLGGDCVWRRNDEYGRPNYAGGDGFSAAADSDACGSGTTMDTALVSPTFSVGAGTSLDFVVSYRHLGSSRLDIDVAADGGAWSTIQSYTADLSPQGPGEPQSLPLDDFSGQAAQVRFRYVAPGWDWWAQVDQIEISGEVDWLEVSPDAGNVSEAGSQALTLSFDAGAPSIVEPGQYFALIVVENDTPYGSLSAPVTLSVEAGENQSQLTGQVVGLGYCGDDPAPLAGATVEVTGQSGSHTLTTDANGMYQVWLNVDDAPLSIEASAAGHLSEVTGEVGLVGGGQVVVDFDLTLDAACATVAPDSLNATVVLDGVNMLPLEIGNVEGGADLAWTLETAQVPAGHRVLPPFTASASTGGSQSAADLAGWLGAALPGQSLARSDHGLMVVDCESEPGIVIQDDGTVENGYSGNPATVSEVRFVDRYTPEEYPAYLTGVCVAFLTISGSTSFDIDIVVYDDSGAGGAPGSEIDRLSATVNVDQLSPPVPPDHPPVWTSIDLSSLDIEVTSGSIYVGVSFNPVDPNYFVAGDQSTDRPIGFSGGHWWNNNDNVWEPIQSGFPDYRALMVRPVLLTEPEGCDAPEAIGWLSVAADSGTTAAGTLSAVTVTLDADGLAEGVYEALLCIGSNDPVNPLVEVPVTMNVVDQAPAEMAVDMTEHDFGQVGVGTSAVEVITVSNVAGPGAIGLMLGSLSVAGDAGFSIGGGDCAPHGVVEPGESCSIAVMFAPAATGAAAATLSIGSADGQNAFVDLAGEGVQMPEGLFHDRFEVLD